MGGQREARLVPTIRALRARAEQVRQQELAKASTRLAGLDDQPAGRGRGGDQGPGQQAAPRPHGPGQDPGRPPRRRPLRRRPARAVRPRPPRGDDDAAEGPRAQRPPGRTLRLATRGSALALAQSRLVVDGLRAAWPELRVELVTVVTEGDRRRDVPAAALGGKGIFTAAVQEAVLDGRADLAVHSAKDLPAAQVPGLVLAAVPRRDDPRDVLVGRHRLTGLDDLAPGARVGTGSPRRVALLQLAPARPRAGRRSAATSTAGSAGSTPASWTRSSWPPPACAASAWAGEGGRPARPGDLHPGPRPGHPGRRGPRGRHPRPRPAQRPHPPPVPGRPAGRALVPPAPRRVLHPPGRARCCAPTDAGPLEIQGFLSALDGKGLVRERLRGPADDPEGLGRTLADRLLDACGPEVRALVEDSRR